MGYFCGMNMHIKALSIAGAFAFGILLSLPMAAQGPTFIDPVSVVESDNVDSVMVAEWLVTNATENAMTSDKQFHQLPFFPSMYYVLSICSLPRRNYTPGLQVPN